MSELKTQHEVIMRVRFDKPCTATEALAAVKDNIHGNFYPNTWFKRDNHPEEFWVKSFKHKPRAK